MSCFLSSPTHSMHLSKRPIPLMRPTTFKTIPRARPTRSRFANFAKQVTTTGATSSGPDLVASKEPRATSCGSMPRLPWEEAVFVRSSNYPRAKTRTSGLPLTVSLTLIRFTRDIVSGNHMDWEGADLCSKWWTSTTKSIFSTERSQNSARRSPAQR